MQSIKIFLEKSHYNRSEILEFKPIHEGYTNQNFLIKTNDLKEYIYRIPIKLHDFNNEFNAYKIYQKNKFIDFDLKTGVYIKRLIKGRHPDLSNNEDLKKVIEEVQNVHKLSSNLFIKSQNWFDYIEFNILDSQVLSLFYKLINKLKNDPKAFTHHDLNALNILLVNNDKEVVLIDWEWSRFDSPYFDFATLALNEKVDEKFLIKTAKIDKKKLEEYKFLVLVFSHMWCIYMNTPTTLKLKDKILLNIKQMIQKIV